MKQQLHLLKIGGKVIEDAALLQSVLQRFHRIEGPKLLIHGGGKRATQMGKLMGTPAKMIKGRRITDAATLEIVTMVYAGLYNKRVVAQLQALGNNAIGLSGADANVIEAHKRVLKDIDYGFAGDIDRVNADNIQALLHAGLTPVFCAITHDKKGQLLNTNADTVAAQLAIGMSELYDTVLYFCFEKNGVLSNPKDDNSVIPEINRRSYVSYQEQNVITDGMIPKLDNAFEALRLGVSRVIIGGPEGIATGSGTSLRL